MNGVNKVILVGNLGRDPEMRFMESDRQKASFPLATTENYTNRAGERTSSTEWHNVVLWGGMASVAEKYLRKGSQVYIEGKITSRSYQDKEGNNRYITEVVGRNMVLLGRKEDTPATAASAAKPAEAAAAGSTAAQGQDELPF